MTRARKGLGDRGEKVARQHLKRLGYKILRANYRSRVGEIDLVAEDGDTLVFVEVRTKSGPSFDSPAESIDARKRRKLVAVAQTYLAQHGAENRDWRIDVVAVEMASGGPTSVDVVKNAIEAS